MSPECERQELIHARQEVVVQQQAKPENALATIQEEAKSGSLGESVISQEANMAEGPLPSQTEPSPAANPTPSAYTELEGGSIQEILPDMQDTLNLEGMLQLLVSMNGRLACIRCTRSRTSLQRHWMQKPA